MDEPQKLFAKWQKLDKKGHAKWNKASIYDILYFHLHEMSRIQEID